MSDKKLHQLLTQVHEHLQNKSGLDEQSRVLLQQVLADVKLVSTSTVESGQQDLSDRIEQQAVEFEEAHPTLSEILRQIMDTLGRIGV
jgi:methyl-accepting chemotaxis protein